jgi:hypothetical protein
VFRFLVIDSEHNKLLCNTHIVGKNEVVEIYEIDKDSPPQAIGKLLQKIKDPNLFIVHTTFDGHESQGKLYELGECCILRVVARNRSGTRRRKFAVEERVIIDIEKGDTFHEKKVTRAKTGSVRKPKNLKKD